MNIMPNFYYKKNMTKEEEEYFASILMDNLWLGVLMGSKAYGTDIEGSDDDMKYVAALPKRLYYTLGEPFETLTRHEPDVEFHSPPKFLNMLNKQNPTIMEMAHVEERFIIHDSIYNQEIRRNRNLFLSSNCFYSYGGYATEQLMRIKAYLNMMTQDDRTKHLLNTINNLIHSFQNKYSAYKKDSIKINSIYIGSNGKETANVSIHFDDAPLPQVSGMISELANTMKTFTKGTSRNKKTIKNKLLKHAMHLVRLLLCGIEALENGVITVYMEKHRQFLLDIRNGKYTWEEIFKIVEELEIRLQQAYERTILPHETNFIEINTLYQDLMMEWMK